MKNNNSMITASVNYRIGLIMERMTGLNIKSSYHNSLIMEEHFTT